MKRTSLIYAFIMLPFAITAQGIIQQTGVTYRYNGKNARTPLGNVTIIYGADHRSTLSGEQDGTFTLTLQYLRMGDRIEQVTIRKREMMVFNQHAVDEWSVRKEPLMLILCNADEFERQKENLIKIGQREAKKKYDRQKAELEAQLSEGKIKLAEKEAELDKAYDELEKFQKNVGEIADVFARIDESEVDTLAQEALEMFRQGEVDRAIELFEQGRYMERLDKAIRTSQQADKLKAVAEQAKAKASQDSLQVLQSLKAQIEAYKMNNDWDKAGELLKGLADRLKTVEGCKDYAKFCKKQHLFKDAVDYNLLALSLLENREDKQTDKYLSQKVSLQNNLANLYKNTQRLEESEAMYKEALETYRRLAASNPQAYEPHVATTLNNLAGLYADTQRLEESEAMFREALETYRRLAASNPQAYEPDVAMTLNNLAILYSDTQRLEESEAMYKEALEIYRRLAQSNPQTYEPDLAATQYGLGLLKVNQEQHTDAVQSLEEALEISRRLAKDNSAQQQWYHGSLCYLSQLYSAINDRVKAYQIYQEWIPILKVMYEASPEELQGDYAITLGNQSFSAIFMKQYHESEMMAREGLATDSTKHWIASNLAAALLFQGKYAEAETLYRQYKDELKDSFLDDFKQFSEAGVIPEERKEDVERIKRILIED